MAKRLVVIDGMSIFYRAFYAMSHLTTPEGQPIGGVYGFASMLLEIAQRFQPDYWAVAWDKPQTNIRQRRKIYPNYKANRKKAPDEFYAQLPLLDELFTAFHIPKYEYDDYEADDIMGTLAKSASKSLEVDLISSDLDMLQALGPNVRFFALKTGLSNIEEFDEKAFERKYGVLDEQFLDLKALRGDASDNIPGVPGVGPKTAAELLATYGNLEKVFAAAKTEQPDEPKIITKSRAKLLAGEESALVSRELGRLICDAPIKLDVATKEAMLAQFDAAQLQAVFRQFGFRSLLNKLARQTPSTRATDPARALRGELRGEAEQEGRERPAVSPEQGQVARVENGLLVSSDIKAWLHQQDAATADQTLADFASKKLFPFDLGVANFLLNRQDADLAELQQGFNANPRIKWVAANLDFPLIPVLYKMEKIGIKLDSARLAEISTNLTAKAEQLAAEVQEAAGSEFNLNSPAQLSQILFEKLQLPTDGIRKTQSFYSTGRAELAKLHDAHPVVPLIEQYRILQKLLSTYVDALPKQMDEAGRIHTTLSQTATSTGRLASSSPNLQNIPIRSELGRQIRSAFIADESKVLIEADYSQFELRIAAALSGEQKLIEAFNAGEDAHLRTASQVFGVPADQVTKQQRAAAKTINFGVLYGISATGLAAATQMSRSEALAFINRYFATYPKLDQFMKTTLSMAKKTGYAETWLGRRHYFPDLQTPNFLRRQAAERAAMNMPVQGTEADLMKLAMIRLDAELTARYAQAHLLLQVHDSLLVEAPKAQAKEIAALMDKIMEEVAPKLPVRLSVDTTISQRWGE